MFANLAIVWGPHIVAMHVVPWRWIVGSSSHPIGRKQGPCSSTGRVLNKWRNPKNVGLPMQAAIRYHEITLKSPFVWRFFKTQMRFFHDKLGESHNKIVILRQKNRFCEVASAVWTIVDEATKWVVLEIVSRVYVQSCLNLKIMDMFNPSHGNIEHSYNMFFSA